MITVVFAMLLSFYVGITPFIAIHVHQGDKTLKNLPYVYRLFLIITWPLWAVVLGLIFFICAILGIGYRN
jgi:hypothetical protein